MLKRLGKCKPEECASQTAGSSQVVHQMAEAVPSVMPQHQVTSYATSVLPFFCPCEKTFSSAWLQPLCGTAINSWARPTLAGGGTRRLNAECLRAVWGSCGLVVSHSMCVLIYEWDWKRKQRSCVATETKKSLFLKACWEFCLSTYCSLSITDQTKQHWSSRKSQNTHKTSLSLLLHV